MKDLEVAQTDQTTTTTGGKEASAAIFNKTNRPVTLKSISSDSSREDQNAVKQTLVSAFKTNIADKLKSETHETGHHHGGGGLQDKQFERWNTTWWQQFSVLLRRGVKERKHQAFSFLKIGQVLVVSFLAGLLWWQSDISHLQDQ
ncbi:unnamed protein product [Camellia sinensis]